MHFALSGSHDELLGENTRLHILHATDPEIKRIMECLFSTDNKFGPRYEVAWHRIIIVISAPLDNYRAFCALKNFSLDVRKPLWCREKISILSFNIILNFKLCIQVTIRLGCSSQRGKMEKRGILSDVLA